MEITDVYLFLKPHSHLNGFYWGHQCSWIAAPANIVQAFKMQSDDLNWTQPRCYMLPHKYFVQ